MASQLKYSGFSALEVTLIIAILAIVMGSGYFVALHYAPKPASSNTSSHSSSGNTAGGGKSGALYGVVTSSGCPGASTVNGSNCSSNPVADMQVTAINIMDQTKFTTTTDAQGAYHLAVKPGTYTVSSIAVSNAAKNKVIGGCQSSSEVVITSTSTNRINISCSNGEE